MNGLITGSPHTKSRAVTQINSEIVIDKQKCMTHKCNTKMGHLDAPRTMRLKQNVPQGGLDQQINV